MKERDRSKKKPAAQGVDQHPPSRLSGAAPETLLQRVNDWIRPRAAGLAIAIFLLSLGMRVLYYEQSKDTPLQAIYQWDISDMEFFHRWALHMAEGDWLCDTVLHPYHTWHNDFAKEYLQRYPESAAKYYTAFTTDSLGVDSLGARKALVNDYYNGKVFHQEPLYPYLMALTYRFLGPDQNMVYLWQLLLGAISNALIFLIGLRLFGGLAGLGAAVIVMLSGPVMVFDMVLLRTTLTVFLSALLLHLYLRVLDRPERWRMIAFGAASGFALLAQSYLILFLLPAWAWLAWILRGQWKTLGTSLATYSLALLAVMSPLFIRNAIVGVPWGALASNGAITYIPANTKTAQPMDAFFVHNSTLVTIMHESGGSFGKAVLASLRTFDDAADFWRIYRQKIDGLFMWWEAPNNMNYYAYKEYSPLLKSLPEPYGWVAPLAIAGLLFGFWRFRAGMMPLLLMGLASAAPLIIGSTLARYRVPFVVIAALPAAWLLLEVLRLLLAARWKELLAASALAALAFWYTSGLPRKLVFPYYGSDFLVPYKSLYLGRLTELEKAKDDEGYLKLTTEFLGYLPDHFFEVKVTDPILVSNEAESSRLIARFVDMHAGVLLALGRQQEAERFQERSRILRTRADDFDQRIARKKANPPVPGSGS